MARGINLEQLAILLVADHARTGVRIFYEARPARYRHDRHKVGGELMIQWDVEQPNVLVKYCGGLLPEPTVDRFGLVGLRARLNALGVKVGERLLEKVLLTLYGGAEAEREPRHGTLRR